MNFAETDFDRKNGVPKWSLDPDARTVIVTELDTKPAASGVSASPTLARRMLLDALNKLFTQSRKTLDQLAEETDVGTSTVRRWLRGENLDLKAGQVLLLCAAFGYGSGDETTQRLVALAKAAKQRGITQHLDWFVDYQFGTYVDLERAAKTVSTYQSSLVPGLLQTPTYTEAVVRATVPDVTDEGVAERVKIRQERQEILRRSDRPVQLLALLHESVIRVTTADPIAMRDQLMRLIDAATWENVTIQVIPFTAGPPPAGPNGPFVVLGLDGVDGFDGIGPIAYVELPGEAVYRETPKQVRRYISMTERLRAVALDVHQSAKMIGAALDQFGR